LDILNLYTHRATVILSSANDSSGTALEAVNKNQEVIDDLLCYVNFTEEKLLPEYKRFQNSLAEKTRSVRYPDLNYLFCPGNLIYSPRSPSSSSSQHTTSRYEKSITKHMISDASNTGQTIWRVSHVEHWASGENPAWNCTVVICYRLDFDGDSFGAVQHMFRIHGWKGKREVTDLPVYPLQYLDNWEDLVKTSKELGEKFVTQVKHSERYAFYRGFTLNKDPMGVHIISEGGTIKGIEHVESSVLVDFKEAFNRNPTWKPEFLSLTEIDFTFGLRSEDESPTMIKKWDGPGRSKLLQKWEDPIVQKDGFDIVQRNEYIDKQKFLSRKLHELIPPPEGEDLVLLPRRILAYTFWDRRFVNLDVKYFEQAQRSSNTNEAFDSLEINPGYKEMIEALIHDHFAKRADELYNEIPTHDLIKGKGKGVIILLHGVPGVGKTATAEAVAEKFKQPLFPITCGDLGITPNEVEHKLRDIFRLAHHWGCVLLLDEAEIFITQRNREDLKRNAMVSGK
jgi:ATPase family associated with various cellular activities (AAA)